MSNICNRCGANHWHNNCATRWWFYNLIFRLVGNTGAWPKLAQKLW